MGRRRVEISKRENDDLAHLRTMHQLLSEALDHDVRRDVLKTMERDFLQRLTDLVERRADDMSAELFRSVR